MNIRNFVLVLCIALVGFSYCSADTSCDSRLAECISRGLITDKGKQGYQLNQKAVADLEGSQAGYSATPLPLINSCKQVISESCATSSTPLPRVRESAAQKQKRVKTREEFRKKAQTTFKARSSKKKRSFAPLEDRARKQAASAQKNRMNKRKMLRDASQAKQNAAAAVISLNKRARESATVRSGLSRTQSLVALAVAQRDKRGSSNDVVLRFGPKRVSKYLTEAPRYATIAVLVSAKNRYPATCTHCKEITDTFFGAAKLVANAQSGLWNSTADMTVNKASIDAASRASDDQVPIRVPVDASSPSGHNLPIVFVELDLDDNSEIFQWNQITTAPSIVVYPPVVDKSQAPTIRTFIKDAPTAHRPVMGYSFTIPTLISFLQTFTRDPEGGKGPTAITALESSKNPIVEFLSSLPMMFWVACGCVFVIVLATLLKYASIIVSVASRAKLLVALLWMAAFAFNATGGIFNKGSAKVTELWPAGLRKTATFTELMVHAERYMSSQFRDQYMGEGLLIASAYLSVALLLALASYSALSAGQGWRQTLSTMLFMRAGVDYVSTTKDVASASSASVSASKADSEVVAEAPSSKPKAAAAALNTVSSLCWTMVQLFMFACAVYGYFLVVRGFSTKLGSYGEVMWTHRVVSSAINQAIAWVQSWGLPLTYRVPSLLYVSGK